MTIKKLFKKHPEYLNKKITIVDITNHWSFELNTNYLFKKPIARYNKKLLKRKINKVFIDDSNENLIEIQVLYV